MHGQKRDEYKARLKDDATAAKLAHKAQQWHTLSQTILLQQQQRGQQGQGQGQEEQGKGQQQEEEDQRLPVQDLEAMEQLTEKLLCVNPDPIYLWNRRRELLVLLESKTTTANTTNRTDATDAISQWYMKFWEKEQTLTQTALYRNPKAYGAWFHRKWALRTFLDATTRNGAVAAAAASNALEILKMESHLCGEFLLLDERNFHCWNYRRFIVGLLMYDKVMCHVQKDGDQGADAVADADAVVVPSMDGSWSAVEALLLRDGHDIPSMGAQMAIGDTKRIQYHHDNDDYDVMVGSENKKVMAKEMKTLLMEEWDFTTEKIEQNFSNGSAFHYRSKLLPLLMNLDNKFRKGYDNKNDDDDNFGPSFVKLEVFQKELELIRNAIFTEPDDQTSWWYFRFILSWANPDNCQKEENAMTVKEFQSILYDEWTSIQELVEGEDGKCKWGLLGLHMIASEFCKMGDKHVLGQGQQDWKVLEKDYLMQLKALDPDRCCRYESMLK